MDDATPTTDQPTLVIRHDLLDLWLRDACPPYTAPVAQRASESSAPPAPAPGHQQESPTDARHAE
jgi:hypothetical protein